ncbi:hypothetical protein ACJZ2D_003411 [Fusarium nematophilum]
MASRQYPPLPIATGSVDLVLLDGGSISSSRDSMMHANGHDGISRLYNWCFYIRHRPSGLKLLWDVGISNDLDDYTPFVKNNHFPQLNPVGPRLSLTDQLASLGVEALDISLVIFSHAHWDHARPVKKEFPNAKVFFGQGTISHCSPGHIREGKIMTNEMWDSRLFGDENSKIESVAEFSGPWGPWGPFEKTLDLFNDGSLRIIQAPGHMAGNLAAAVRLSNGEHALLTSDCCHSRDLLTGKKKIAQVLMPDGSTFCLHEDIDAAYDTISRLREAANRYGMHILMAHDAEWIKEGSSNLLMSLLHPMFDKAYFSRMARNEPL